MNPNENNPVSPAGVGGTMGSGAMPSNSSVPSALDFTNTTNLEGSGVSGSTTGAATNIDGTASMAQPMQPLTPAEPVPGSIGSVTSVPPLAPEPMDMSGLNNGSAKASNMPVMGQAGGSKPADAAPAQPYYNPFTRNNVGGSMGMATSTTTPASGANVPPVLQPSTGKFSDRLKQTTAEKKPHSIMPLLGWLLALLFAVVAVVFAILWQTAEGKEKVVYYPSTNPDGEQQPEEPGDDQEGEPPAAVIATVNCTRDLGSEEVAGLVGLTGRNQVLKASYTDGALATIQIATNYTFADAASADAAREYFDGEDAAYAQIAESLGIAPITVGYNIAENILTYELSATPDKLVGEYADRFMLPKAEDGTVVTEAEAVKSSIEAAGMVCTVE